MEEQTLTTLKVVATLWPIFAALVGGAVVVLIWFIRLEGKVNTAVRDIEAHKSDVKENNRAIWDKIQVIDSKFDKVFESLGEIKGLVRGGRNEKNN